MTDARELRILIIRPSALGDVCRTVPVLRSLRQRYPDARIDWVVQEEFAAAVSSHPALDTLVPFPRRQLGNGPRAASAFLRWGRALRRERYDLVIDCQGLLRSALIARMTGASRRIGDRRAREGAWLLYTARHDVGGQDELHAVDRMLALLQAEGIEPVRDMRLYLAADDEAWWSARRVALLADRPYGVLAPTARWASKRWPIERWGDLLQPLRERGLGGFVIIGAPSEQDQVAPLVAREEPDVVNLVGQTTIGQTMAVIAGSCLTIANDSAPLHMAVGFDRPLVGLFGATNADLVGPYERRDAVVEAPVDTGTRVRYRDARLGDTLMRQISHEAVLERVDDELARSAALAPTGSES